MTKTELKKTIKQHTKSHYDETTIIDAVARHTKAIIAQSKCSTLREQLVQMVNSITDDLRNDNVHPLSQERLAGEKRALEAVIKLVDARLPVA